MALENCVRGSSTLCATAMAGKARPFYSNQKLISSLPEGLKKPNLSFSILPKLSPSIISPRFRKSNLVCKARRAVDDVKEVTESSWDEVVIGNDKTVLVDFWAPWCGPCRMIEPIIKELAEDYAGKIVCLKLNTDNNPNIASKYGIKSIPTVVLFKDGQKKESVIGAVSKSTLSTTIDKYL